MQFSVCMCVLLATINCTFALSGGLADALRSLNPFSRSKKPSQGGFDIYKNNVYNDASPELSFESAVLRGRDAQAVLDSRTSPGSTGPITQALDESTGITVKLKTSSLSKSNSHIYEDELFRDGQIVSRTVSIPESGKITIWAPSTGPELSAMLMAAWLQDCKLNARKDPRLLNTDILLAKLQRISIKVDRDNVAKDVADRNLGAVDGEKIFTPKAGPQADFYALLGSTSGIEIGRLLYHYPQSRGFKTIESIELSRTSQRTKLTFNLVAAPEVASSRDILASDSINGIAGSEAVPPSENSAGSRAVSSKDNMDDSALSELLSSSGSIDDTSLSSESQEKIAKAAIAGQKLDASLRTDGSSRAWDADQTRQVETIQRKGAQIARSGPTPRYLLESYGIQTLFSWDRTASSRSLQVTTSFKKDQLLWYETSSRPATGELSIKATKFAAPKIPWSMVLLTAWLHNCKTLGKSTTESPTNNDLTIPKDPKDLIAGLHKISFEFLGTDITKDIADSLPNGKQHYKMSRESNQEHFFALLSTKVGHESVRFLYLYYSFIGLKTIASITLERSPASDKIKLTFTLARVLRGTPAVPKKTLPGQQTTPTVGTDPKKKSRCSRFFCFAEPQVLP